MSLIRTKRFSLATAVGCCVGILLVFFGILIMCGVFGGNTDIQYSPDPLFYFDYGYAQFGADYNSYSNNNAALAAFSARQTAENLHEISTLIKNICGIGMICFGVLSICFFINSAPDKSVSESGGTCVNSAVYSHTLPKKDDENIHNNIYQNSDDKISADQNTSVSNAFDGSELFADKVSARKNESDDMFKASVEYPGTVPEISHLQKLMDKSGLEEYIEENYGDEEAYNVFFDIISTKLEEMTQSPDSENSSYFVCKKMHRRKSISLDVLLTYGEGILSCVMICECQDIRMVLQNI